MAISITLPDGSVRNYDAPVTAAQVAMDIGPGLAKAALACKVDGEMMDLATLLDKDCHLGIVTEKRRTADGLNEPDPEALLLLRHSCAHVMAEAIQRIVPEAQLVYGPPLETGFYYDIRFPDDRPLREGDFEQIEKEMEAIVAEDRQFTRYELAASDGMSKLQSEGSKYKIDNAEQAINKAGATALSFYATGEPGKNWEDLCRGPHVPSTGKIGAFKMMSLASSYWHGDENSDRLTRVYGTAFFRKKDLETHLNLLEEAKQRDHRVIGKKLRLFHIDDAVGQGLILWTPAGAVIRQELQTFISEELRKQGYHQIFTPHIGKLELYKTSGHFPYYADSQFPPLVERDDLAAMATEGCSCAELSNRMSEGDIDGYMLKPMNCPHHIKVFDSQPHSYRDLPVRLAEFGTVYRWEQSGELSGMLRVRSFTQDDAHLFCTEDQIGQEVLGCLSLVRIIFETLGMENYRVRVGLRDPDSSKYTGDPSNWDKAEAACIEAARALGAPFTQEPGEAAFYGPKIDFVVKDVIGREWQLGTVQVDYNLPIRFDLSYIGPDNQPHRPVMIHRAPFGSMERFCGFLIEHFAGSFPTWLAPEQVRVLPISEKSSDYAERVLADLRNVGVRATMDLSGERIQAKIRDATEWKIPYLLIVGPRDAENENVSVRARGIQKDLGAMKLAEFVDGIAAEIRTRGETSILETMMPGGTREVKLHNG
ncbi:MAG: threonine--tRNA ligase [Phycisphaeraceae bacterium]|nr:threonine--tRNA ligase [Phycisphaerales bacterium]MCB9860555.1 threonine--tRNA ligase [Phycisphaeraceae bacterium]